MRITDKKTFKDEKNRDHSNDFRHIIFTSSGLGIIMLTLFFQFIIINSLSNSEQILIDEKKIASLNNLALPIFILYVVGLSLFIIGIKFLFKRWICCGYIFYNKNLFVKQYYNFRNITSFALRGKGQKIFSISLILYLILALFLNNTIIYKDNISFSSSYGIHAPSLVIIGCCGDPGEFPLISFYLTDHFGLMLIPLNLITSISLSILAGLNISLIYRVYKTNKNNGLSNDNKNNNKINFFSIVGIIPGLFVSCPVCAGHLLLLLLVGSSLISAGITITFTHYQSIFLIFGYILMIVFPFIANRNKILFVND